MQVRLLNDSTSYHTANCTCGMCDANGRCCRVGIYDAAIVTTFDEAQHTSALSYASAPTEDEAYGAARVECALLDYEEVGWPCPQCGVDTGEKHVCENEGRA